MTTAKERRLAAHIAFVDARDKACMIRTPALQKAALAKVDELEHAMWAATDDHIGEVTCSFPALDGETKAALATAHQENMDAVQAHIDNRKWPRWKICVMCGKQFRPRKDGCFPKHTVVFTFDDMPDKDGNPYVTPRAPCKHSGKPITDRNSL